jgi:hypothetical protein
MKELRGLINPVKLGQVRNAIKKTIGTHSFSCSFFKIRKR